MLNQNAASPNKLHTYPQEFDDIHSLDGNLSQNLKFLQDFYSQNLLEKLDPKFWELMETEKARANNLIMPDHSKSQLGDPGQYEEFDLDEDLLLS